MEKKEKIRFSSLTKTIWAFNAGMWLMIGLQSCTDDSTERVADIQEHNMQLEDSLERDFPGMGRLILNDDTDTFEFHVDSKDESLTCKGEYSVNEEEIARPVGNVTCSQTIKLTKGSS